MQQLKDAAARFRIRLEGEARFSRMTAALQLACGIDLRTVSKDGKTDLAQLSGRIRRALERERLRGLARHWSYDLNRHIALKQALIHIGALAGEKSSAFLPRAPDRSVARGQQPAAGA